MTQTELLYKDPLAAAEQAAKEIAAKTGIAHHDVALVMGSGWVSAVDALGTPVFECNAEEFTGFLLQLSKVIQAKFAHMKLKAMERSYVL